MADGTDPNGGQGGQSVVLDSTNWGQFIPADLKDDLNFKPFEGKEIGEIFRSFVNAQRMTGADKVIVPAGKNDTPQVWNEVLGKLGRPQSADGYQFDPPQLPEGVTLNPDFEKTFKDLSHFLGLLPWQAKGLYQYYHDTSSTNYERAMIAQKQAREEIVNKAQATLKTEYGAKYDDKIDLAKKVIRTYGGKPEEVNQFVDRYGNDPIAIRTLVKLGEMISEDKLKVGERAEWDLGSGASLKKAVDIQSNTNNPLNKAYYDKSHPQHMEAVNEVERLYQLAQTGGQ